MLEHRSCSEQVHNEVYENGTLRRYKHSLQGRSRQQHFFSTFSPFLDVKIAYTLSSGTLLFTFRLRS